MIFDIDRRIRLGADVPECLAKTLLAVRDEEDLDDLDMAILASAFMIDGVETFSALISSYPDVQKRAQEELDRVVGRNRLPNVDDEAMLPYCHAIVKEIERCHNPFWLGTPHVASEDFTYQGQFIPQGTVCILNTWTMHHDPERYPGPYAIWTDLSIQPERFLHDPLSSAQSSNLPDPTERDHWMFGAGRRICLGMAVAKREIWLAVSRMLWAFDMDASPDHLIALAEYDGLSGRSPVPFKVYLKPRHENVEKVLRESASSVKGLDMMEPKV
ncbi:cytochrome P450 [Xylaria telfairii]|nr:cytochrome P450 [Xylaria telfairii]